MKRVTMNVYYEKCHYEMITMKSVTMKPYTAVKLVSTGKLLLKMKG